MVREYTHAELQAHAEDVPTGQRSAEASGNARTGSTNPVRKAALRRLLDALPPGPHTPGELHVVAESVDMSGLADSTRKHYAGAMRSFIRDLA